MNQIWDIFSAFLKKRWTSNNKNRVYRVTERNELYYRGNRNITAVAKLYQNLTNNQSISRVVVGYWNHYFACMTGYLALSCICTHLWYNFFYIVSLTNLVGTKGTFFSFFFFLFFPVYFSSIKAPLTKRSYLHRPRGAHLGVARPKHS